MTSELRAEPIVGWRAWYVMGLPRHPEVDALWSMNLTLWVPGRPLEAKCYSSSFVSPLVPDSHLNDCSFAPCDPGTPGHVYNGCGIYAHHSPTDARDVSGSALVFGEVDLWGVVWEHRGGYRAQYAQIRSLYSYHPYIEKLAKVYEVDFHLVTHEFDVPPLAVPQAVPLAVPQMAGPVPPSLHSTPIGAGLGVMGLWALACLLLLARLAGVGEPWVTMAYIAVAVVATAGLVRNLIRLRRSRHG